MDNLKIFEKEEFGSVRVSIDEKNEPWFCLADVCRILNIKNVPDTKQRLDIQDCCSLKLQRENQEVNRAIVMHCKSGDKPKWQFTTLAHSKRSRRNSKNTNRSKYN